MNGRRLSPMNPRSRIQCSISRTASIPLKMSTPQKGMNLLGWRSAIFATSSFGIVTLPADVVSSKPVISDRSTPPSSSVRITSSSSMDRAATRSRTASMLAGSFQNTLR